MTQSEEKIPANVLQQISNIVGPKGAITDRQVIEPLLKSWRDNWMGDVPLLVQPANVEEMAAVVALCHETGTAIVPQGGNTGLTGASQPHDDRSEIILSTSRMNEILDIDLANDTITVEAGCILANIQQAADEQNRVFPLSLAAEGTCQIGGNLSTNAGGTQVLRYGNARALVLGLEVILSDGRIWDGLRGLRKDNTGYDLKHMFIGAEGTLGIITKAVLKLFPKPSDRQTFYAAVPDSAAAVSLLSRCRAEVGDQVTTFEIINRLSVEWAVKHVPEVTDPLEGEHPWYVLVDICGQGEPDTLRPDVERILEAAYEAGEVLDAALAGSAAQADALWGIREGIPQAQNYEGTSVKHDVSVPLSRIPEFLDRADAALLAAYPGIRLISFGHIGDGNIHYNPAQPEGAVDFDKEKPAVNRIVHDLIAEMRGSISAEHGLGRLRMVEAERYKSDVELDLMATVKRALDPKNILNPGKVIRLDR